MTDVEALLSADAGRVEPGTEVFIGRDEDAETRRLRFFFGALMSAGALGVALAGGMAELAALMALGGGMLAVLSLPTTGDPAERRIRRPTLVLTKNGIIVRDAWGLRRWTFDELSAVRPYLNGHRVGLLVVQRNGAGHFIDHLAFERGERLGELIGRHLRPQQTA
jgi:hypothetical protein